jgi:hypothetical protein
MLSTRQCSKAIAEKISSQRTLKDGTIFTGVAYIVREDKDEYDPNIQQF